MPAKLKDFAKMSELTLDRSERLWVVDRSSRLGSVPLEIDRSRLPGKGAMTASIAFSETSVPETIAISEHDELGDALTALGGAPEHLA